MSDIIETEIIAGKRVECQIHGGQMGIWDAENTNIEYDKFFDPDDTVQIMNQTQTFFWTTAEDGKWNIEVRLDGNLEPAEQSSVVKSAENYQVKCTSGKLYVGDVSYFHPDRDADIEPSSYEINAISLKPGDYSVSVYLLKQDEELKRPNYIILINSGPGRRVEKALVLSYPLEEEQ